MLPALASVASVLLGVPATSTSSERSFCLAGRMEECRTTLSADPLDGTAVLTRTVVQCSVV